MRRRTVRPDLSNAGGMARMLGYARISGSEHQKEGYSLDDQVASNRGYAVAQSFVIDREYLDILSGRRDDRPGYQKLLDDCRRLRAEGFRVAVVVKRLDRFGRNMLERVRAFKELMALGAELHSVTEGGRVTELMANILASVAVEESRVNGERVSDMHSYLQSQGWIAGRVANWGYRWRDPSPEERAMGAPRRVLEPHPDECSSVRELWRRAASGEPMVALARWAAELPVIARGGRKLSKQAVRLALRCPVYIGRPGAPEDVQAGVDLLSVAPGHWPALCTDEQWFSVREHEARRPGPGRRPSGRYLLTGLLRCHKCGGRMVGTTERHKRPAGTPGGDVATFDAIRYRCQAQHMGAQEGAGRSLCTVSIQATTIDDSARHLLSVAVEAILEMDAATERAVREWWAAEQRRRAQGGSGDTVRRQALEVQRAELSDELAEAARLLVRRTLDPAGYEALRSDIDRRHAVIADQLAALSRQAEPADPLPDWSDVVTRLGGIRRAVLGGTVDDQREALNMLAEQVIPVRQSYGRYSADVQWNAYGRALIALSERAWLRAHGA